MTLILRTVFKFCTTIGVPAEKNLKRANTVLPKFCDVCPNHDFPELYKYEKKIYLKFRVKTKI